MYSVRGLGVFGSWSDASFMPWFFMSSVFSWPKLSRSIHFVMYCSQVLSEAELKINSPPPPHTHYILGFPRVSIRTLDHSRTPLFAIYSNQDLDTFIQSAYFGLGIALLFSPRGDISIYVPVCTRTT